MSLFSFLRKNRQESASRDSEFYSHAEEDKKRSRGKRARGERNAGTEDPALPEKKRARRRLVGALALVLAAVIGLPMLLDSQPQPVADDISIQIPSKDKASLPAAARPEMPGADPESDKDAEETTAPPEPRPVAPAAPAGVEAADTHEGKAAAPSRASSKPEQIESHATAPKPASKTALPQTAAKDADAARALAILNGKTNDKPATDKTVKTNEKFVVQVAALATKAKVSEVQSKLKHAGIQSYTQSIATKSGERTRIRIGPFSSHEDAEKMRARVVKLGFSGGAVVPGSR